MTHTATPWIGQKDGVFAETDFSVDNYETETSCSAPIVDANGKTVALVVTDSWDESEMEANAAFIVRACNAHDALVDALTYACDELLASGLHHDHPSIKVCLDALAKAAA